MVRAADAGAADVERSPITVGATRGLLMLGPGFATGTVAAALALAVGGDTRAVSRTEATAYLALAAVLPLAFWVLYVSERSRYVAVDREMATRRGPVAAAIVTTVVGVPAASIGFLFPAATIPAVLRAFPAYAFQQQLVERLWSWRLLPVFVAAVVAATATGTMASFGRRGGSVDSL